LPTASGSGPASASFKTILAEQLSPQSAMWIVADEARWAEKPAVQLAAKLLNKTESLPVLANGRAAAVGLAFGDAPKLRVFLRTSGDEPGGRVREYFQRRAGDGAWTGGANDWALVEWPLDAADPLGRVKSIVEDAGKK
jgi:hypothetical protein